MVRVPRPLVWLALLALVPLSTLLEPSGGTPSAPAPTPLVQLLGPFARLAADLSWIGFERARLDGRTELALTRAERALALAPGDARGWDLFGSVLGLDLASVEREPEPARRRRWLEAGLDALRRGEERVAEPGRLALVEGVLLLTHAEQDPELPWPGGRAGLWRDAAAAGERAARLGVPEGADLAAYARERAAAGAAPPGPGR